jgi:FkbM family methyltransferase
MPYPLTGDSAINKILVDEYFKDIKNGFFIETGSCDGIFQSNTYYLETELGWTGLLIEPNPLYAQECVHNRPRSKVYQCALDSFDHKEKTTILYDVAPKGAMGTIGGGGIWSNDKVPYAIVHNNIPVRTLNSILDDEMPNFIDFLSLDVEGYELNVLKGIDFNRYKPKIIVVESFDNFVEDVNLILSNYYKMDKKISERDYVYILK